MTAATLAPKKGTVARYGRKLFVVDIENMVGTSQPTISEVCKARTRIKNAVTHEVGDHVIIGSSGGNAEAANFGWAGSAQHVIRNGKDGADLALLECISDAQWIAARYDTVVIASGDHIFAFAVAALKAAGCEVLVIAPDRGFSKAMRLAAGPDFVGLGSSFPAGVIELLNNAKDAA